MENKVLSPEFISLLREIQKFLIEEPRRFNMSDGVASSRFIPGMLEEPPCGTACCIGGAGFVIGNHLELTMHEVRTRLPWGEILDYYRDTFPELKFDSCLLQRLFYVQQLLIAQYAGRTAWPQFYGTAYMSARTPLERACIGVARIEHFIATDGAQ